MLENQKEAMHLMKRTMNMADSEGTVGEEEEKSPILTVSDCDEMYVVFEREAREPHFHRSLTHSTHSYHSHNS